MQEGKRGTVLLGVGVEHLDETLGVPGQRHTVEVMHLLSKTGCQSKFEGLITLNGPPHGTNRKTKNAHFAKNKTMNIFVLSFLLGVYAKLCR